MPYNTRSNNSFDILNNSDIITVMSNSEPISNKESNKESNNNLLLKNSFDNILNNNDTIKDKQIIKKYTLNEKNYYKQLNLDKKELILSTENELLKLDDTNTPFRFKLLQIDLPLNVKNIIIKKIEQLNQLDADTEYYKLNKWLNTFFEIPFGKYTPPLISNPTNKDIKQSLKSAKTNMDKVIYGHADAKNEILEYICNSFLNPNIKGKILALQGPPGNGKTTLIKNGVSQAMNKYFGFVPLGGSQDSSFLQGFDYTYEGSTCGQICNILKMANTMDPIIYFDELDKISNTPKGEEIAHCLCHITDSSQNTTYYDRYLSEVPIDLSKVTFIFSFNDEGQINPILKDRLNIIRTKGYCNKDKLNISHNYLLPDIFTNLNIKLNNIIFSDKSIEYIIKNFTEKEEGVRELKRNLEKICSKINIYNVNMSDDSDTIVDIKIKDFKLPIVITEDICNMILKKKHENPSIEHLYI